MQSMSTRLISALHAHGLQPVSPEPLVRRDFLPPETFDHECPGLSELRRTHFAILDELEAAESTYDTAWEVVEGIEAARLAALQAGADQLPSRADAETARADAALLLNAAREVAAPALAEIAVAARDALPGWGLAARREEIESKRAEAERLLTEAEHEAAEVGRFDGWSSRLLSDGATFTDDWRPYVFAARAERS